MGELGSKTLVRPLHDVARIRWYELRTVETRMELPLITNDGCQVRHPGLAGLNAEGFHIRDRNCTIQTGRSTVDSRLSASPGQRFL